MKKWQRVVLLALVLAGCSDRSVAPTGVLEPDSPGAAAGDYLRADTYDSLLVRVDYTAGMAPVASSLAFLERELALRTNKPAGVQVVLGSELVAPIQSVYTVADCQAIERQNRTLFTAGTQAVIYVICVPGMSDRDLQGETTLGLSDSASSFVLFEGTIQENASFVVGRDLLEGAVLLHESGHLLGLVAHGTPELTSHQDPFSAAHCTGNGCLMQAESTSWNLISAAMGRGSVGFCEACLADLRANGGR
jgi:predicted Zn-dependent protease